MECKGKHPGFSAHGISKNRNQLVRTAALSFLETGDPFFIDNPDALQIMLFFDEFTAVNLVGHQVKNYKIAGTVSVVIADNLGAHGIGGYMESFTTLRNCRFCFIDKHHMQTKYDCSNFNMRTPEMYNDQARLVQDDPTLASVYGIKRSSTLNKLSHFHVVGKMSSDIEHD
ncbi:unnamed protein product [Mytilus coruscus]|uniref:Uncharacterized protein n=1 Tax=Mytilus coruscus TaxID=42192 RepID=A0A6J8BMC6_MYTCO|nr:unnamed protein product [Mytilus coruscus]